MKRLSALVGLAFLVACGGYPDARHEASANAPEADLAAMTQTASGLNILDLEVGSGEEAMAGKTVTVYYTGWFLDGEKFDSSLDRGETYSFQVGQSAVIRGWHEGVAGMRVGGWRRLVIPPELGYGAQGRAGIPPNSTLVFDIELLDVK
jgi:FKBP-type peptidyl-prolyl cis-trans isomerase FkpA